MIAKQIKAFIHLFTLLVLLQLLGAGGQPRVCRREPDKIASGTQSNLTRGPYGSVKQMEIVEVSFRFSFRDNLFR